MNVFGRHTLAKWSKVVAPEGQIFSGTSRIRISEAFKASFALATLSIGLSLSEFAQTTNGLITGTVVDPTGAVVPRATITVTDLGTHLVRNAFSDEHGYYIIPQLPPAIYNVVVSKEGFTSSARPTLQLHVNEEATIDFKLTVGSSVQRVDVTATAPPLNTTSATLGDVKITRQPLIFRSMGGNLLT